ncbi:hypothetical protein PGB90_006585 [Kerria lacca]
MIKRNTESCLNEQPPPNNVKSKSQPCKSVEKSSTTTTKPNSTTKHFTYPTANSAYFHNGFVSNVNETNFKASKKDHATSLELDVNSNNVSHHKNALAFPLTLNSILSSCSINGQTAPLADLNFNSILNGSECYTKSNFANTGYTNGYNDSNYSSISPSTSSSFGSVDSNANGVIFNFPPVVVPNSVKSKMSSTIGPTFSTFGDITATHTANHDFSKINQLIPSARTEFGNNVDSWKFSTKNGVDDNDNLQHFWDARMKDIADAMKYLELI